MSLKHTISLSTLTEPLFKAHKVLENTPKDLSKIPLGSSAWITITDENSPLHGRHVLITMTHGNLLRIDSLGTASSFLKKQHMGKLLNPTTGKFVEAKGAQGKEALQATEEHHTKRLAGGRYIGKEFLAGASRAATEENKRIKEERAKVRPQRSALSQAKKQEQEKKKTAVSAVLEHAKMSGLNTADMSKRAYKTALNTLVHSYMESLRAEGKKAGMSDPDIDAKLSKYSDNIEAAARQVLRHHRNHQQAIHREYAGDILRELQSFKAKQAAALDRKKGKKGADKLDEQRLAKLDAKDNSLDVNVPAPTMSELEQMNTPQLQSAMSDKWDTAVKDARTSKTTKRPATAEAEDKPLFDTETKDFVRGTTLRLKDNSRSRVLRHVAEKPEAMDNIRHALEDVASSIGEIKRLSGELKNTPLPKYKVSNVAVTSDENKLPSVLDYATPEGAAIRSFLDEMTDSVQTHTKEKGFYQEFARLFTSEEGTQAVTTPGTGAGTSYTDVKRHVDNGSAGLLKALVESNTDGLNLNVGGMVKTYGGSAAGSLTAVQLYHHMATNADNPDEGRKRFEAFVAKAGDYLNQHGHATATGALQRMGEFQDRIDTIENDIRGGHYKRENQVLEQRSEQDRLFRKIQEVGGTAHGRLMAASNFIHACESILMKGKAGHAVRFLVSDKEQARDQLRALKLSTKSTGDEKNDVTISPLSIAGNQFYRVSIPVSRLAGSSAFSLGKEAPEVTAKKERAAQLEGADAEGYYIDKEGNRKQVPNLAPTKEYNVPSLLQRGDKFTDANGTAHPFELRPEQRNGIEFIKENKGRGMLTATTGAGKTLMLAGSAATFINEARKQNKPYMGVISVNSKQVAQWQDELSRFMKPATSSSGETVGAPIHALTVPEATAGRDNSGKRNEIWRQAQKLKQAGKSVIVLTAHRDLSSDLQRGRDGKRLPSLRERSLIEDIGVDGIFGDEFHQLMTMRKDKEYHLSAVGQKLQRLNIPHRVIASATLAKQNPGEFWDMHQFVYGNKKEGGRGYEGNPLGPSRSQYAEAVAGSNVAYGGYQKLARAGLGGTLRATTIGDRGEKRDFNINVHDHVVSRTDSQRKQEAQLNNNYDQHRDQLVEKEAVPFLNDMVKKTLAKYKGSSRLERQKAAAHLEKLMTSKEAGANAEQRMAAARKYLGLSVDKLNKTQQKEVAAKAQESYNKLHQHNLTTVAEPEYKKLGDKMISQSPEAKKLLAHNAKMASFAKEVSAAKPNEKHIIFVESPEQGAALKGLLQSMGKDKVSDMTSWALGMKYTGEKGDARTKAESRADVTKRIEDEKQKYLKPDGTQFVILDTETSAGHNFQNSNHVHVLGKPPDAAVMRQVIGRADRPGRSALHKDPDVNVHLYRHNDSKHEYDRWDQIDNGKELIFAASPGADYETQKSRRLVHFIRLEDSRFFVDGRQPAAALAHTLGADAFKSAKFSVRPTHKYTSREWKNGKWVYTYPDDSGGRAWAHVGVGVHPKDPHKLVALFDTTYGPAGAVPHQEMLKKIRAAIPDAEPTSVYSPDITYRSREEGTAEVEIPLHAIDRLHDFFAPGTVGVTEQAQKLLEKHDLGGENLRYGGKMGSPQRFLAPLHHAGLRMRTQGTKTIAYGPDVSSYRKELEKHGFYYDSRQRAFVHDTGDILEHAAKIQTERGLRNRDASVAEPDYNDRGPAGDQRAGDGEAGRSGADRQGEGRSTQRSEAEDSGLPAVGPERDEDVFQTLSMLKPPEPTAKLDANIERVLTASPDISDQTKANQVRDVRLACSAYAQGRAGFLDASDAGTGKSFVAAAVVAQMKPSSCLWILPWGGYTGLRDQTEKVLKSFGLKATFWDGEGEPPQAEAGTVVFTTYGHLASSAGVRTGFEMVVADEAHNAKNLVDPAKGAEATKSLMDGSKYGYWMSATPFENTSDMAYLENLGIWKQGTFSSFAARNGCTQKVRSVYKLVFDKRTGQEIKTRTGTRVTAAFDVTANSPEATVKKMLGVLRKLNERLVTEGFCARRVPILNFKLNNKFVKQPLAPEHSAVYNEVMHAFSIMDMISPDGGNLAWHRSAAARRILESAKIPQAIAVAKSELAKGRQIMITTQFKSPRVSNMADFLLSLSSERDPELEEVMRKPLQALGGISIHDRLKQIKMDLPSPIEELTKAFGRENVALVYGDIPSEKQIPEKDAYNSGQKKILIGVLDAVGTGHSFHDTTGDAPRTQINLTMPWSATKTTQLWSRSHREGTKSDTNQFWLFSDVPSESRIARIVATRMKNLKTVVTGADTHEHEDAMAAFQFGMLNASADDLSYLSDLKTQAKWKDELYDVREELQGAGHRVKTRVPKEVAKKRVKKLNVAKWRYA